MVLALEPFVGDEWMTQDLVLVTRDGPKVLSTAFDTSDLFRIAVK